MFRHLGDSAFEGGRFERFDNGGRHFGGILRGECLEHFHGVFAEALACGDICLAEEFQHRQQRFLVAGFHRIREVGVETGFELPTLHQRFGGQNVGGQKAYRQRRARLVRFGSRFLVLFRFQVADVFPCR